MVSKGRSATTRVSLPPGFKSRVPSGPVARDLDGGTLLHLRHGKPYGHSRCQYRFPSFIRPSWSLKKPGLFEGLLQVADNVLNILNTHGEAEETIVEFCWIQILPFVLFPQKHDEALIMTQGDGGGDDI